MGRAIKTLGVVSMLAVLTGCAATIAVLDILCPDPVPVCDAESIGVTVGGDQCVKLSDGSYRWRTE